MIEHLNYTHDELLYEFKYFLSNTVAFSFLFALRYLILSKYSLK